MTTPSTPPFHHLKPHIISLATALYGTTASPHTTFDVLPFTSPHAPPAYRHGAALIYYTGGSATPFTAWEMLSYADAQPSVAAGAQQLLEDMQRGVGEVIGGLVKSGEWAVRHKSVPDLAGGEQQRGGGRGEELGRGRWGAPLRDIDEEEEDGQRGQGQSKG